MPDFLLELLSEEIPARMQPRARDDLARLFAIELAKSGLAPEAVETYSTPRRLALIARGLPPETRSQSEELKGPRTSAPPQALEGFLRKTGLTRDQLTDRDGIWYAVIDKPGRPTAHVLAEAIPAIVRAFPWPKSMRWGAASTSTESLRWVRPLQGIVALLGEEIVPFEIDGIASGSATVGHRFHHPGRITIGTADDYAAKLREAHVIVDHEEREAIIATGATTLAAQAGLELVRDEALLRENAGLTEWPVPLLGRFDEAFLGVPPEVIQLTMATNQKYFACLDGEGALAPAFICTANLDATDGGAAIVAGNQKVLAARLADAKFFWDQDRKVELEEQAKKLDQIVFHEKLGTVADKVDRVAKLARWLCEEGIVKSSPGRGGGPAQLVEGGPGEIPAEGPLHHSAAPNGPPPRAGEELDLANLAETAARLCKADLVTGMVGEFPELQGVMGGYYARAEGLDPQIADAIRDHYKPVGQGDEVPTAPVTVAVSLADKLDSLACFFAIDEKPTGSKDPFALRRSALAAIQIVTEHGLRLPLTKTLLYAHFRILDQVVARLTGLRSGVTLEGESAETSGVIMSGDENGNLSLVVPTDRGHLQVALDAEKARQAKSDIDLLSSITDRVRQIPAFFADRLKVQQREAGVRHDLIDAVFALGGEDDLVRLLARVRALQAFVETAEGRDLLAGYKRAANILKKSPSPPAGEEGARSPSGEWEGEGNTPSPSHRPLTPLASGESPSPAGGEGINSLSYLPEPAEQALIAALDSAGPRAEAAIAAEDFEGAMTALATLRGPVDAFFEQVTVNDADPAKRSARLALLARIVDAVHQVADFSQVEG